MTDPFQQLPANIKKSKSVDQIWGHLRELSDFCDKGLSSFVDSGNIKIECKGGCSYCCHFRVSATPHEIFFAAEHIDKKFKGEKKEKLLLRLRKHKELIGNLSIVEQVRKNIICPFLQDSKCSIYSHRPFACRSFHSKSLKSCIEAFEDPENEKKPIEMDPELQLEWGRTRAMISNAFRAESYNTDQYEFSLAIFEVIRNPKLLKRWRQGKKPFIETKPDEQI